MKHHKYHHHYQIRAAKMHSRAEAAYDFLVALVIGVGIAALLVAWWSSGPKNQKCSGLLDPQNTHWTSAEPKRWPREYPPIQRPASEWRLTVTSWPMRCWQKGKND